MSREVDGAGSVRKVPGRARREGDKGTYLTGALGWGERDMGEGGWETRQVTWGREGESRTSECC